MIYLLHSALAVTAFLIMLNEFLLGSKKAQIDGVLGVALGALLVTAFVAFGWRAGALAVILAFVYARISRPIAASTDARLHSLGGGPSGVYIGLPHRTLERISKQFGREFSTQDFMRELMTSPSRRDQAMSALIEYCVAQPEVERVMREFGATRETLYHLFWTLHAAGARQRAGGHFVAASALAYPQSLRFVLQNQRGGLSLVEQVHALLLHFERGVPLP